MKTSIDLPDDLYRKVKSKSALEGLAVREVATALFAAWVDGRIGDLPAESANSAEPTTDWKYRWQTLGTAVAESTKRDTTLAESTQTHTTLVDQLRADRR